MAEWHENDNPYIILGLEKGVESSPTEIKKAYRKLVLEKHPDKQPGNKQAADEFVKLQRAYEILTDDKAKEAWDALQRATAAREAKQAGQSEKRRKVAEDLERRERAFDVERRQEKAARSKLQAELDRLRKQMAEREAQREAEQLRERVSAAMAGAAATRATMEPPAGKPAEVTEEMRRTLKVSWDLAPGGYTSAQLRDIFGQHGEVEDVVIRQAKKKQKGSALVIMAGIKGAAAAAGAVSGSMDNPLLVVPLAKVPTVTEAPPQSAAFPIPQPSAHQSLFPMANLPAQPPPAGSTFPLPSGRGLFPSSSAQPTTSAAAFPGQPYTPAMGGVHRPAFGAFPDDSPGSTASSHRAGVGGANGGPSAPGNGTFESSILAKMRQRAEEAKLRQQQEQQQQPA